MVVSGLSGAGKTAAAKLFEDLGYTVVDNLPGELLPDLAELVSGDRERFARVAIVLDVRAGDAPLAFASEREDWIQNMVAGGLGICIIPEFSAVIPGIQVRPLIDPDVPSCSTNSAPDGVPMR